MPVRPVIPVRGCAAVADVVLTPENKGFTPHFPHPHDGLVHSVLDVAMGDFVFIVNY